MHHLSTGNEVKKEKEDICLFAQTNYRNQLRRFGIKTDDRRRHMYVIGKTGMGKTTMMENMVLSDIYAGHGVGIVDPHGDFAEKIINYIPPNRINDVVYFNPGDMEYPIGFNILEVRSEEQKHLVVAGLMAIFKKIWPDVWSSRMEYILNNTLLALLDYPGSTLLGINRLLADKIYRKKVVSKLKDPVVKAFWQTEFANYPDRYMTEAVAPIQNKIGQFLSASVIRNMVAQVKSTINVREIMDTHKIFIINVSKGRIGEDNSRLLGGMIITELQLAAMGRVDIPEKDRQDFFLYVDEFQNFATPSFANILSEARKYRLSLIMAHQYVMQLDEIVADAVFGNVGTIVTFRVGGADAETLEKEFEPTFMGVDIVNLAKYQVFLKLMIDGVASQPFSALTMPPIGSPTGSAEKVIKVSRERYGKKRDVIEDKILRWSGMGEMGEEESEEGENDTENIETEDLKIENTEIKKEEVAPAISLNDLLPKNNSLPKSDDLDLGIIPQKQNNPIINSVKDVDNKVERWKDLGLVTGKEADKVLETTQQNNKIATNNEQLPTKTIQNPDNRYQIANDNKPVTTSTTIQSINNTGGELPRKKKRRNRHKKKSGLSQLDNQTVKLQTPITKPQQPTVTDSANNDSRFQVIDHPPKIIKPDEIITFNTTDDDDYDTDRAER